MGKFNLTHTAIVILLFFSALLFFRLNSGEVQPWDEGLYAVRAKSIIKYSEIIDQSKHSIGGLYSATYPPVLVWAQAGAMKLFGETLFAIRLFPALCSILSLIFIYFISNRIFSKDFSIIIIIGMACTLSWNTYSRQGMTDIPLITFIIISFWTILKLRESKNFRTNILYGFLFAFFFALGLMTKTLISLFPLLFVLLYLIDDFGLRVLGFRNGEFKKMEITVSKIDSESQNSTSYTPNQKSQNPKKITKKILLIMGSIIGLVIAFPWHYYMIKIHGYEFYRVFFAQHLYSAVENNAKNLGIFYYINQLIISNPFVIFGFILSILFVVRRNTILDFFREYSEDKKFVVKSMIIWFVILFIIFSAARTKLLHYTLYMLPPLIILSGIFYEHYLQKVKNEKVKWYFLTFLLLSVVWSISYELRQNMKDLLTIKHISISAGFFIFLIIFSFSIPYLLDKESLKKNLTILFPKASYMFLILLVMRLLITNTLYPPGDIFGGKITSRILEEVGKKYYVYLYHNHNGSDTLNPQLAWYTGGWNCGWLNNKSVINISLPEAKIDLKQINKTDIFERILLVYYLPEDRILAKSVIREISAVRPVIIQTRNYIIFGTKHFQRKIGAPV